jgi:DNA-binding transcriptional ArsR family regulator
VATDELFSALANPVRRRLLELLASGSRNAGSLAAEFELSRPAISEHLQVLRKADLVTEEVVGRERHYHLNGVALAQLNDWLHPFERYWRERLRTLDDVLAAQPLAGAPARPSTKPRKRHT